GTNAGKCTLISFGFVFFFRCLCNTIFFTMRNNTRNVRTATDHTEKLKFAKNLDHTGCPQDPSISLFPFVVYVKHSIQCSKASRGVPSNEA
uniref:Uncharacterized protein n=1 Tax=Stegastes partitus TaxID=144197 RepID=A0A3B4Z512_9TELE